MGLTRDAMTPGTEEPSTTSTKTRPSGVRRHRRPAGLPATAAVLAVATAALTAGFGTAARAAVPTYSITAGSASTGQTVAYRATSAGSSPQLTWKASTGTTWTCGSGTFTGAFTAGSGQPATLGTLPGTSFAPTTCTGPFGWNHVYRGAGTWQVRAIAGSTTSTQLTITDVTITVDGGSNCRYTMTGSLTGVYQNATHTLAFPGTTKTLTISGLTGGCLGIYTNGSTVALQASFTTTATTAAYNPIRITSP